MADDELIVVVLGISEDIDKAQPFLNLAKEADPESLRTIVVLTIPHSSPTTMASQSMDILKGETQPLKNITYFVVVEGLSEASEAEFFGNTAPFAQSPLSGHFTIRKFKEEVERRLTKLLWVKYQKFRRDTVNQVDKVRQELSTIPKVPEDRATSQVLRSVTQLAGTFKPRGIQRQCLDASAEFVVGIKQTAPNFIPSDSATPFWLISIEDDKEPRESQTTSARLNFSELREHFKNARLPEEIDLDDKHELVARFQENWLPLATKCLDSHQQLVVASLTGNIAKLFPKYEKLRSAMVAAVTTLVAKHYAICLEFLETSVETKRTPATRSVRELEEATQRWLRKYEVAVPSTSPWFPSASTSFKFKSPAPQAQAISTPTTFRSKPIQEEYQRELKVMAEVRGYFYLVHQRIIDEVLELIELKFLKAISNELQSFLLLQLKVDSDDADRQAVCEAYMAEDAAVTARREELSSREKKLVQALEILKTLTS
ncbi:hypothetical protein C8J56DRAFT_104265 [Mycena floridula]|nr:hypothetical protein C8J56DRAFT_104265 [Mycena floridula]